MRERKRRPQIYNDGLMLGEQGNQELDATLAQFARTDVGKVVLDYLKRVSINRVLDENCSDQHLRMQEGKRQLFFDIQERIQAHHDRQKIEGPNE